MNAQQEILEVVKARAREDGIPFGEALPLVMRERPELAREYREEVIKPRPTEILSFPQQQSLSESPAARELVRLARDEMKATSMSLGDALVSVCRKRPELASEYRREVTGAKPGRY